MKKYDIKIGIHMPPQYGDMKPYRDAWMKAEELGVDRIYNADHFHAQVLTKDVVKDAAPSPTRYEKNFEATTVQAAMAATTSRVEIGCLVHANSYRNPNLMADMARTIDHISGGRFILGMGSGYLQPDYDEYGYEFGTAKSRMMDFVRDIPIIKARLGKLNPPPLRRIPLLMAAMGEIGMGVCAEHADIWHVYGELEKIAQKCEAFKQKCREIGRDPAEVELSTSYFPGLAENGDPDAFLALGITHIIVTSFGPDWDLGLLREMLEWKQRVTYR
jgi:probable F420-dependent oxidoreductase